MIEIKLSKNTNVTHKVTQVMKDNTEVLLKEYKYKRENV